MQWLSRPVPRTVQRVPAEHLVFCARSGVALLAAADGQLGEIMQVYRDWRISGDNNWLKSIWSKVEISMNYCINTWDPLHNGYLLEPQHNTYDIEFWGPNGMCTSIYLGALKAIILIADKI